MFIINFRWIIFVKINAKESNSVNCAPRANLSPAPLVIFSGNGRKNRPKKNSTNL